MSSGQETIQNIPLTRRARLADYLGLERNVSIASATVFLIGLGEELWKKFLPKYLEYLGASSVVIGLFGTTEDLFDAVGGNRRASLEVSAASAFCHRQCHRYRRNTRLRRDRRGAVRELRHTFINLEGERS